MGILIKIFARGKRVYFRKRQISSDYPNTPVNICHRPHLISQLSRRCKLSLNYPRWLAGLLANKKSVAQLLRFLKATEVGASEGAREREAEWVRKNHQVGEDLLG